MPSPLPLVALQALCSHAVRYCLLFVQFSSVTSFCSLMLASKMSKLSVYLKHDDDILAAFTAAILILSMQNICASVRFYLS